MFEEGPKITSSTDLADWLAKVASGEWVWTRNSRCKYVTLKIDTRRGAYCILDRDEKPITAEELLFQFGD